MKRKMKTAFEYDAFTAWGRKFLCYVQRSGVRKKAKQQVNRRERREAKKIEVDEL